MVSTRQETTHVQFQSLGLSTRVPAANSLRVQSLNVPPNHRLVPLLSRKPKSVSSVVKHSNRTEPPSPDCTDESGCKQDSGQKEKTSDKSKVPMSRKRADCHAIMPTDAVSF